MRLKAKNIGDELSLDEYNAYQYLLYNMECWEEKIHLDMEVPYAGDYARYLLNKPSFLLNDKHDTYKVKSNLTSSSKLVVSLSDITPMFDKYHMKFGCTLYYKPSVTIDGVTYQPSDDVEHKLNNVNEQHERPDPEKEYKSIYLECVLNDLDIEINLWDAVNQKPFLEKNDLIYRWLKFDILLNDTPYIDVYNGKANEPYEILLDSAEQLINVINKAPNDGTLTVVRLDSSKTYNIPHTLEISKGQNIEIRGGTATRIANQSFKSGRAVLNGKYCRRSFVVKPGGKLKLDHITLVNNNSIGRRVYDRGRGGAILVESLRRDNGVASFGILKCDKCLFQNNKAVSGGAIFSYHAGLFLNGCDFISNSSTNNGGAVYFWAKDVKLHFNNLTVANGTTIQLKIKVTDYMARVVDEGTIDFYLKTGNTEKYLDTIDVSNYIKVRDTYNLTTVPKTGTVKNIITDDNEVVYEIITKNNLPVTVTRNGLTYLKPLYDSSFKQVTLAEGESKTKAVFKEKVDNISIPLRFDDDNNNKKYLDYTNTRLLKYVVYLDELTEHTVIPNNSVIKKEITDSNNEIKYPIILKYDKPVLVTEDDVVKLKNPYDEEFNPIELEENEVLLSVVFKKNIVTGTGNELLPTVKYNNVNYLDYDKSSLLKYLVYHQLIDSAKINKGWLVYDYTIPATNTKTVLQFIAVYKGGATYDSEVAMNTVNVIFPNKYTAEFVSKNSGSLDSTITISVKITSSEGNIITKPVGTFTINGKKYTAMTNSETYYLKYKLPESVDSENPTISLSFEIEKSIYYICDPISSEITIGDKEKYLITGPINGLFVDPLDVQKTTPTSSTYTDEGISDSLVSSWINAGISDIFVRCEDYNNAQKKATLISVLNKTKGKNLRVHAVINCFYEKDGKDSTAKWTNVNPSSLSRNNWLNTQLDNILNNTAVDGICLDYCRFEGGTTDSWNGNIKSEDRKTHVTKAVKSMVDRINKVNPKTYISLTVMPEQNTEASYGQSFKELGELVDYIMPLAYKGDYSGVSNNSDSWLADVCNLVAKSVDKTHILCCIQTYSNYTELEKAISEGKEARVVRSKVNLDSSVRYIATTGVKGVCLYREGLIQAYPLHYNI